MTLILDRWMLAAFNFSLRNLRAWNCTRKILMPQTFTCRELILPNANFFKTPIPLFILFRNLYFSYFLFFFPFPLFLPFSCFSYKAFLIVLNSPICTYTKYSHQRRHLKKLSNFISSNLILNKRSWNYLVNSWFYFFINLPKTLNLQFL